jgi:hypothetical protein
MPFRIRACSAVKMTATGGDTSGSCAAAPAVLSRKTTIENVNGRFKMLIHVVSDRAAAAYSLELWWRGELKAKCYLTPHL